MRGVARSVAVFHLDRVPWGPEFWFAAGIQNPDSGAKNPAWPNRISSLRKRCCSAVGSQRCSQVRFDLTVVLRGAPGYLAVKKLRLDQLGLTASNGPSPDFVSQTKKCRILKESVFTRSGTSIFRSGVCPERETIFVNFYFFIIS